jgi:hypothetical protein
MTGAVHKEVSFRKADCSSWYLLRCGLPSGLPAFAKRDPGAARNLVGGGTQKPFQFLGRFPAILARFAGRGGVTVKKK